MQEEEMEVFKVLPQDTGCYSKLFLDYLANKETLEKFYNLKPEASEFEKILKTKSFPLEFRAVLVNVLNEQYAGLEISAAVADNISVLGNEKTYTVTTGHQLNLATGPLYTIWKIFTVINLAEELNVKYPGNKFVPVFWMASEDHDLEEIRSFRLFGKQYSWETTQKGPVGHMSVEGLPELAATLPEKFAQLEKAYAAENSNLSQATRILYNELFGKYGLVILDADHTLLKKQFQPYFEKELLQGIAAAGFQKATDELKALGYNPQVFPRDINMFLFDEGDRKRISREGDNYKAHPDKEFTAQELQALLQDHPEKFSPNVLLRPLYQETVLPNVAYIGGSAEVDYWLQTKPAFDALNVPFPMLMPRNFLMFADKQTTAKATSLSLEITEMFLPADELKKLAMTRQGVEEINLHEEVKGIEAVFEKLCARAIAVDKSLGQYIQAEEHKILKDLVNIEKRIKKAQDQKHETMLRQVEKLKEKLFPGGKLQERSENVFSFLANDPSFADRLKTYIQPFDFSFKIVAENE